MNYLRKAKCPVNLLRGKLKSSGTMGVALSRCLWSLHSSTCKLIGTYGPEAHTSNIDSIVSSMREQLVAQVGQSYNFYAPKVFNLTSNAGAVDPRNSAGGKAMS